MGDTKRSLRGWLSISPLHEKLVIGITQIGGDVAEPPNLKSSKVLPNTFCPFH